MQLYICTIIWCFIYTYFQTKENRIITMLKWPFFISDRADCSRCYHCIAYQSLIPVPPFGIINVEDCETTLSSKVNECTCVRKSRAWCTTTSHRRNENECSREGGRGKKRLPGGKKRKRERERERGSREREGISKWSERERKGLRCTERVTQKLASADAVVCMCVAWYKYKPKKRGQEEEVGGGGRSGMNEGNGISSCALT